MSKYKSASDYVAEFRKDPDNNRLFLEHEIAVALSDLFLKRREEAGLTQADLAQRVGRTQPYIAKLEAGAYDRCSIGTLRTFARALGFEINLAQFLVPIAAPEFTGKVTIDARLERELSEDEDQTSEEFLAELRDLFFAQSGDEPIVTQRSVPLSCDARSENVAA
jgi:transcriptional regulator with XRE-family HTH domain